MQSKLEPLPAHILVNQHEETHSYPLLSNETSVKVVSETAARLYREGRLWGPAAQTLMAMWSSCTKETGVDPTCDARRALDQLLRRIAEEGHDTSAASSVRSSASATSPPRSAIDMKMDGIMDSPPRLVVPPLLSRLDDMSSAVLGFASYRACGDQPSRVEWWTNEVFESKFFTTEDANERIRNNTHILPGVVMSSIATPQYQVPLFAFLCELGMSDPTTAAEMRMVAEVMSSRPSLDESRPAKPWLALIRARFMVSPPSAPTSDPACYMGMSVLPLPPAPPEVLNLLEQASLKRHMPDGLLQDDECMQKRRIG